VETQWLMILCIPSLSLLPLTYADVDCVKQVLSSGIQLLGNLVVEHGKNQETVWTRCYPYFFMWVAIFNGNLQCRWNLILWARGISPHSSRCVSLKNGRKVLWFKYSAIYPRIIFMDFFDFEILQIRQDISFFIFEEMYSTRIFEVMSICISFS
jgi:hypothetical protein